MNYFYLFMFGFSWLFIGINVANGDPHENNSEGRIIAIFCFSIIQIVAGFILCKALK